MPAPRRSISLAALLIPPVALLGSIAVLAVGIVMAITENDALVASLNSPDATAADVYGGQSRIAVAAAVLAAGIIATVVSLGTIAITGSLRAFGNRTAATEVPADEMGGVDGFDEVHGFEDDADDGRAEHDAEDAEAHADAEGPAEFTPGASSPAR